MNYFKCAAIGYDFDRTPFLEYFVFQTKEKKPLSKIRDICEQFAKNIYEMNNPVICIEDKKESGDWCECAKDGILSEYDWENNDYYFCNEHAQEFFLDKKGREIEGIKII
jgi:hypothetical protein